METRVNERLRQDNLNSESGTMQIGSRLAALLIVVVVCGAASSADKPASPRSSNLPQTILLIRHAEEPPAAEKSSHLSPAGLKRAAALIDLFKSTKSRPDPLPVPDLIIAAKSSKRSQRPLETVTSLAQTLKVPVNANYDDEEDLDRLVADVLRNPQLAGKTILICWRQESLPDLARKLGVTDAPKNWKGEVFDRVWQITYGKDAQAKFQDRPQSLLPGDSE